MCSVLYEVKIQAPRVGVVMTEYAVSMGRCVYSSVISIYRPSSNTIHHNQNMDMFRAVLYPQMMC